MGESMDVPCRDRPWRRAGSLRYALTRAHGIVRPPVTVYEPDASSMVRELDVAIPVRDGTVLRGNVYRPVGAGRFPVLVCAHPYGKDDLPARRRMGGYRISFQFRALRQTGPMRFSTVTSWEAPDPAWWVEQGYAVVNCDLRGAGTSDGTAGLLSDQEGEDVHDLVEWAGSQPWSSGRIGLLGVSYLAISQWKAAAAQPPSLRAICPWEGFTDAYRDLLRPGGIREDGFVKLWSRGLRSVRQRYDIAQEQHARPLRDEWWRSLEPQLERITVPALICGSFSDNNLHSRGSFRGFQRIASPERHLYTHRGGKWATFYSPEACAAQLQFFDRHLRQLEVPALPRVRLEVRESRDVVTEVRTETDWPLPGTEWTPLYLSSRGLTGEPPVAAGSIGFDLRKDGVRFGWTVADDVEITGPAALRLWASVDGADDIDFVVGIEKWCRGKQVPFEGSYGYGRDRVSTGWQKASLRALDTEASTPSQPVHTFTTRQPLTPGQIVPVDIALSPSATAFRQGEQLRLVIAGRWLSPTNPLTGQFPARYQRGPAGRCTLHWGPTQPSRLLLPFIPADRRLHPRRDLAAASSETP